LIIAVALLTLFTERGQVILGDISNKGFFNWLLGEGNAQAEHDAADELEKNQVIVIREQGLVTSLNFGQCIKPDDALIKQIAKLYRLSALNLADVEITDDQLACVKNLNNLTNLVLNGTAIGDAGVAHVAGLQSLVNFQASHTKITDKGLEQIAKLPGLKILELSNTGVTDKGMPLIARMKNLDWLLIRGNNITDAGLAKLEALPDLKRLTLSSDMKISPEALEKLKKVAPGMKIDMDRPGAAPQKPAEVAPPADQAEKAEDSAAKAGG
jgi:hypothetical protein